MDKIGVVGLGVMGIAVAKKLLEAGQELIVFDVFRPSVEKAAGFGAKIGNSIADVGRQASVILMFLPGPVEVEICVTGKSGLLSACPEDAIIVDLSTVDPSSTASLSQAALEKNVRYLDAPVLGRPDSIGKWALPVGGSKSALERCESVLRLFAAHVIHIGESGSGNKVKLLNQMMFGAINAMTAEMMAVSNAMGISPKLLFDTIMASQAGTVSNLFRELGGRISDENYVNPTFTVDLLIKDIRLGVQMAKEYQAPPLLGNLVSTINEISQAQGFGKDDTSIMWKSYQKIWGNEE